MVVAGIPVNTFQWLSLSVIIVLVLVKLVQRTLFSSNFSHIPGPKAYPIIGNVLDIGQNTTGNLDSIPFVFNCNSIPSYYRLGVICDSVFTKMKSTGTSTFKNIAAENHRNYLEVMVFCLILVLTHHDLASLATNGSNS